MSRPIPFLELTAEGFAPFGWVLEPDPANPRRFQVVLDVPEAAGWRLAISSPAGGPVTRLGAHPNSHESFAPVRGVCLLVVAPSFAPEQLSAFVLDRPVCVRAGVWHMTVALSPGTELLVTENSNMTALWQDLPSAWVPGLIPT